MGFSEKKFFTSAVSARHSQHEDGEISIGSLTNNANCLFVSLVKPDLFFYLTLAGLTITWRESIMDVSCSTTAGKEY